MKLSKKKQVRVAGYELNALNLANVLPRSIEGSRIEDPGTAIHDIDGPILYRRMPLERRNRTIGYADVAVMDVFAEPLLAVNVDARWNEAALLRRASTVLRRMNRKAKYDEMRFVAYSYPKLAIQFLLKGREVAMLELYSWNPVPAEQKTGRMRHPTNFERWSYIRNTSKRVLDKNAGLFEERVAHWSKRELSKIDATSISVQTLRPLEPEVLLADTREVHYAPRAADHHICYELRGQQTPVWCVAASVEMILNFYRWRYDQPRIADELDLGTCDVPNGLPYGQEIKVVNTLEHLSANSLDARMTASPKWSLHRNEIRAHRPLISFIPGHSRTVAGYTESRISLLGTLPYRGLLVYDPWPPTTCAAPEAGGAITRWENFRTTTYRYAFRAELQHV